MLTENTVMDSPPHLNVYNQRIRPENEEKYSQGNEINLTWAWELVFQYSAPKTGFEIFYLKKVF